MVFFPFLHYAQVVESFPLLYIEKIKDTYPYYMPSSYPIDEYVTPSPTISLLDFQSRNFKSLSMAK
jgi:hypothetical protein